MTVDFLNLPCILYTVYMKFLIVSCSAKINVKIGIGTSWGYKAIFLNFWPGEITLAIGRCTLGHGPTLGHVIHFVHNSWSTDIR